MPHFRLRRAAGPSFRAVSPAILAAVLCMTACTVGENIVISPPDPPDVDVEARNRSIAVRETLTVVPKTGEGKIWGWSVEPPLPEGLALDSLTGRIAGRPTEPWPLTTHLLMAIGPGGADTVELTLRVVDRVPDISYASPVADTALRASLHAPLMRGGTVDSFVISPRPVEGYSFDSRTGELAGFPMASAAPRTYTIAAYGPMGMGITTLTVSVAAPAGPASQANLSVAVPATPGNAVSRLVTTWTGVTGGGVAPVLRDTVSAPDGFAPDSVARTFAKAYALAPGIDWAVEVRGLDAADSVLVLTRDTVAALQVAETRAVTVSPARRLATYSIRAYLEPTSENYGGDPPVALTFRRAAILLGGDTLLDTTAAGGAFAAGAFAVFTTRYFPVERMTESPAPQVALRVFGTAPGWDSTRALLSGTPGAWTPGTTLYSVSPTYHGPGSAVPPP